MKILDGVHQIIWGVLVTTLLLLGGLSRAHVTHAQGRVFLPFPDKPVDGLKISVYLDRAETGRSEVPKFRVELRNVEKNDLVLNLGTMAPDGAWQSPNAISLIIVDPQGKSRRLRLKSFQADTRAGEKALFLPLPAGATFSFPVDLDNYFAVGSEAFDPKLKPGMYSLEAQISVSVMTDNLPPLSEVVPGQRRISAGSFDTVNPRMGPPTSNRLQFEVASR
jgi:hypothetical protein